MTFIHTLTEIRAKAEEVRASYWKSGDIPVDIDSIIERMGIDIDPTANLCSVGIEACISAKLDLIFVDLESSMNPKKNFRMRFSLAHELGHYVLHQKEIRKIAKEISSIENWKAAATENGYNELDIEASEFAGRLLVPKQELCIKAMPYFSEFKDKSPYPLDAIDPEYIYQHIASKINRSFDVSQQMLAIRLYKEKAFEF